MTQLYKRKMLQSFTVDDTIDIMRASMASSWDSAFVERLNFRTVFLNCSATLVLESF